MLHLQAFDFKLKYFFQSQKYSFRHRFVHSFSILQFSYHMHLKFFVFIVPFQAFHFFLACQAVFLIFRTFALLKVIFIFAFTLCLWISLRHLDFNLNSQYLSLLNSLNYHASYSSHLFMIRNFFPFIFAFFQNLILILIAVIHILWSLPIFHLIYAAMLLLFQVFPTHAYLSDLLSFFFLRA